MIALYILPSVAVDLQIEVAASAGLKSVSVNLAAVEALGTMRFRAMLERHDLALSALYGDPRDSDPARLETIARIFGAVSVAGPAQPSSPRFVVDTHSTDLPAALRMAMADHATDQTDLELAPTAQDWHRHFDLR